MTDKSQNPILLDEKLISLKELKILSDPLRAHLLEALIQKPRTVKELALEFKTPATRLYYHINLLEKHGLLQVVHTQIVSGIIEKHYQAAARQFLVDRLPGDSNLDYDKELLGGLLSFVLDKTKSDIRKSVRSGKIDMKKAAPDPSALMIRRSIGRFSPEQARLLYDRLQSIINEFTEMPTSENSSELYALSLAFYPTQYYEEKEINK